MSEAFVLSSQFNSAESEGPGVRSLGAVRESLRARLQAAAPQLVLPVIGVAVAAGWGYSMGLAVAQAAMAVIWWLAFRRALAARRVTVAGGEAAPEAGAPMAPARAS